MSRRRRHMETSEVALMAVMTKAMGAFLILMVFGMQYFVPDMTADQISKIIQESLHRAKSDLGLVENSLQIGGALKINGSPQALTQSQAAALTQAQAQAQAGLEQAMKHLDEAAADIERLRVRLDQALAQLRHSEEERSRLVSENNQFKTDLAKAQALITALQSQVAALTAERDKLAAQLQSLAQARQDLAQAANSLKRGDVTKAELAAVLKQVEAAQESLNKAEAINADMLARLTEANSTIKQLQDETASLKTSNKALQASFDAARKGLEAALARAATAEAAGADLRRRLAATQEAIRKLQDENAALSKDIQRLNARVARLAPQVEELAKARDQAAAERDALSSENRKLKDDIAAKDGSSTFLVQIMYTDSCGDADLQLVVSRLRPDDKGNIRPIIQPDGPAGWTPVSRAGMVKNNTFAEKTIASESAKTKISVRSWFIRDVEINDRYAIYLNYVNALPGGTFECKAALTMSFKNTSAGSTFNVDEKIPFGKYDIISILPEKIDQLDLSEKELNWVVGRMLNAKCEVLACDVRGRMHRAELHELLKKRLSAKMNEKDRDDEDEKKAGLKTLDELIDVYGDGKLGYVAFTDWVTIAGFIGKPGPQATARETAVMGERLVLANAPESAINRFIARTNKGWWSAAVARRKLEVMSIDPIGTTFDKKAKEDGGVFADLVRPMVESGVMTVGSGVEWSNFLAKRSQATDLFSKTTASMESRKRTEASMAERGIDQEIVALVDARMRAGSVVPADVDALIARTQAP